MVAHPVGQSRAAQTNSSRTSPSWSASSSSGIHGAATELAPARLPGKIRNPSASARPGPQTKQVGNGWPVRPPYLALASSASVKVGGLGGCRSTKAAVAVAIVASPCRSATPPLSKRSRRISTPNGGGRRRMTCAGPSIKRARTPHTYPPLALPAGPLNRLGIVTVLTVSTRVITAPTCAARVAV